MKEKIIGFKVVDKLSIIDEEEVAKQKCLKPFESIFKYYLVGIFGKKYNLKYFLTEKEAREMIEEYKKNDKFNTAILFEKKEEDYEIIYIYEN